jgi:putative transposase
MDYKNYITIEPNKHGGKPCVLETSFKLPLALASGQDAQHKTGLQPNWRKPISLWLKPKLFWAKARFFVLSFPLAKASGNLANICPWSRSGYILSGQQRTGIQNAKEKGIHIDFINGYVDHVHCLISLGIDQTLSWIMQSIKGESSFWINKNKLTKLKFAWQDEYFVVSVNEDTLPSVRRYIAKQEEHHKTISFEDEFEDFLKRAGFQRFKDVSN